MNWKKGCVVFASACCFPYVATLGWTGSIRGSQEMAQTTAPGLISGKQIIFDRVSQGNGSEQEKAPSMDVEQYLVGVVARQMPADYELEALKAQAVIARTYIYGQMGGADEIYESALDMDYLEQAQLERMWGTRNYMEFYEKVEKAVADTSCMVMEYEGACIDPWFCRCSAGKTRDGDDAHPYFSSVNCPKDLEADDYLQITNGRKRSFLKLSAEFRENGLFLQIKFQE